MAVRRKKKSGAWKGFVAGMGLAGIFGLLLMWAVAGSSGNKIREAFRSRVSVMADRADQFVDAWNRRQVPGKLNQETPKPAAAPAPSKPARRSPTASYSPTAEDHERPALAPPVTAPAPPPAPAEPPPPAKDVTPDDQKQLRELMRQINQSH